MDYKNRKPSGYWTKERCQEEALNYDLRDKYYKHSRGAYNSSLRKGWLDEVCSHMKPVNSKPNGYWTKENCRKEALKYNFLGEFSSSASRAYQVIKKNGWFDELCSHITRINKPYKYWHNKENCHKEALKYKNRTQFYKGNPNVYQRCRVNGWLDDICSHMISPQKPHGYWTKERCKEHAMRYTSKTELIKKSRVAYGVICKNKWIKELCSHM